MQLLRVSGKATKLGNTINIFVHPGKQQRETKKTQEVNEPNLLRHWIHAIVTNPESYSFNEDPKNL